MYNKLVITFIFHLCLFSVNNARSQTIEQPVPTPNRSVDNNRVDVVSGSVNFQLPEIGLLNGNVANGSLRTGGMVYPSAAKYLYNASIFSNGRSTHDNETKLDVITVNIDGISERFSGFDGALLSDFNNGARMVDDSEGGVGNHYTLYGRDGEVTPYNVVSLTSGNILYAGTTRYRNGVVVERTYGNCPYFCLLSVKNNLGYAIYFRGADSIAVNNAFTSCSNYIDCKNEGVWPLLTIVTDGNRNTLETSWGERIEWYYVYTDQGTSFLEVKQGDSEPWRYEGELYSPSPHAIPTYRVVKFYRGDYVDSYNYVELDNNRLRLRVIDGFGKFNEYVINKGAEESSYSSGLLPRLISYTDKNGSVEYYERSVSGSILSWTRPSGSRVEFDRDARSNVTAQYDVPIGGVRRDAHIKTFEYSNTNEYYCSVDKNCNLVKYVRDEAGGTTKYEYDAIHGGVLIKQYPADSSGFSRVERYTYTQKYAWILDNSGGYRRAGDAVWLLESERSCRTTATVNGACAGGISDEVVKYYDYGQDNGPNNLLLRSITVSDGNISKKICYTYDRYGHTLSETQSPNLQGAC